jgi:hypothetical protein
MIKSGFAFHVHHDQLVEFCTDYDERERYIKENKPEKERELRLKFFKLIPEDRLPPKLVEAWKAYIEERKTYDEARETYDKAWKAYNEAEKTYVETRKTYDGARNAYDEAWKACNEAWKAHKADLIKLHEELCPECPWDGRTIFSGKQ